MELKELFEETVAKSKTLTKRPSNEQLLKMYALYKQATEGDVDGKKPGMFDLKAYAKFAAWESEKGKSIETAMQEYIDLVNPLFSS